MAKAFFMCMYIPRSEALTMNTKCFVYVLVCCVAGYPFAGGTGTILDPYQISTEEHLLEVNDHINSSFRLQNDITLTGNYSAALIAPNTDAGTSYFGERFAGRFNGAGHEISGLSINAASYAGLFGVIDANATVSNLTISGDARFSGRYGGILAGLCFGTVQNCSSSGSVTATGTSGGYAGGLCGFIYAGSAYGCESSSSVTAICDHAGGFAGVCNNSTLEQCAATGDVNGANYTGGLAGYSSGGTFMYCFADGNVSGTDDVGGLIGYDSDCVLGSCYAAGIVAGGSNTGGLIGRRNGDCTIVNCYAAGPVSGEGTAGGLFGNTVSCSFSSCYWDKQTSGTSRENGGVGCATWQMQSQSTYAGWDFTDTWYMAGYPKLRWVAESDIYTVVFAAGVHGSIALGDSLQTVISGEAAIAPYVVPQEGYYFAGWDVDFSAVSSNLTTTAQYGELEGRGTYSEPYLIYEPEQLEAVNGNLCAYWKLAGDIDLSGRAYQWSPVAFDPRPDLSSFEGSRFNGDFDGAGHAISNLLIDAPIANYTGLFGEIGEGSVHDLTVSGSVHARADVGILAGHNEGTITGCSVSGEVVGDGFCGGICGFNIGDVSACRSAADISASESGDEDYGGLIGCNNGNVVECYAGGNVSGPYLAGGLIGYNRGYVYDCYATGDVSATSMAGGIAGLNDAATLVRCYSAGAVSAGTHAGGLVGYGDDTYTVACYWNIETSGRSTSSGGAGKTTLQMLSEATYSPWDFADVWIMVEGHYPLLRAFGAGSYVVPDVVGSYVALARNTLATADFTDVAVQFAFNDTTDKFKVVSQNPEAGITAFPPAETPVTITVSYGPDCAKFLPADMSGDCFVDLTDYILFASDWLAGGI